MEYTSGGATISPDGLYRYRLWREWRGTHDPKNWRWYGVKDGAGQEIGEPLACLFVMLNPSTADGTVDDPTIRRCVGFAKRWDYERLEVVNLFAYRATKPEDWIKVAGMGGDPVGWQNCEYVKNVAAAAGLIVCAWGAHGGFAGQDQTMRGWLEEGNSKLVHYALGFTKDKQPRHPLYMPWVATLQRMPE